jgi:hypothetical protein
MVCVYVIRMILQISSDFISEQIYAVDAGNKESLCLMYDNNWIVNRNK